VSDVEQAVLRICAEVLEIPGLLPSASFFSSGGDSLAAMHVVGRIRQEFGVRLRVKALFEEETLGGLAARVAREQDAAATSRADGDGRLSLRDVLGE
jgi:acyl carrier protein